MLSPLNYLPFYILDSNHIPSCTSAGSVIESIFENTIMKTLLGLYTGNSILIGNKKVILY
jgi:hypothetical protein